MMVRSVRLSQGAQKELRLAPPQVRSKPKVWINGVSKDGLEEMRKIPGFHDVTTHGY